MGNKLQHLGLRHLALYVSAFDETKRFYIEKLGFKVEWEPDFDNVYLTSGTDNIALHRVSDSNRKNETTLDHFGLVVRTAEDVDAWAVYLEETGVTISNSPRTHRDGARSFYFCDPDGNRIQIIYHPPISDL
jgi:catechol 2,3-dioxygenase-like lactoylglutathione lyase family enzyme